MKQFSENDINIMASVRARTQRESTNEKPPSDGVSTVDP